MKFFVISFYIGILVALFSITACGPARVKSTSSAGDHQVLPAPFLLKLGPKTGSLQTKIKNRGSTEYWLELVPPSSKRHIPSMVLQADGRDGKQLYRFFLRDLDCDGSFNLTGFYYPEPGFYKSLEWQVPISWGERISLVSTYNESELTLQIGDEQQVISLSTAPKTLEFIAESGHIKIWK